MLEVDNVVAKTFGDRNDDLRGRRRLVVLLRDEFLIALNAGLGLCLTRLGRRGDPFAFRLDCALARFFLTALLRKALLLLLQPGGVIALVRNAATAIEFENPAGDVVEEVAVMGDDQDGAG